MISFELHTRQNGILCGRDDYSHLNRHYNLLKILDSVCSYLIWRKRIMGELILGIKTYNTAVNTIKQLCIIVVAFHVVSVKKVADINCWISRRGTNSRSPSSSPHRLSSRSLCEAISLDFAGKLTFNAFSVNLLLSVAAAVDMTSLFSFDVLHSNVIFT